MYLLTHPVQKQACQYLVMSNRVVWSKLYTQGEFAVAWQGAARLVNTEHAVAANVYIKLVISQYCRGVYYL